MRLPEIGLRIRQARAARGMTQAMLAAEAGVSRATLNELENGVLKDLGIAKVIALARVVGLRIEAMPAPSRSRGDYLALATRAANIGFKMPISEDEILRALLMGKPPRNGRPQLRRLLEDSPVELIRGLLGQVSSWTQPGRLVKQVERLARELDISPGRIAAWTNPG